MRDSQKATDTGNEGPPKSKQATYHEIRHPERQLSHQRWSRFNGVLKDVVGTHLEKIQTECDYSTSNDQWRALTPLSKVLFDAAHTQKTTTNLCLL